jgi:imidazolonepropionase
VSRVSTDHLLLYEHIPQCLTMAGVVAKKGRHPTEADLGIIENASVVVDTEKDCIEWIGESRNMPDDYKEIINRASCEDVVWLPELVECHTHLVYGGHRHHDYALRAKGMTYHQVADQGGGILSTLIWTRETSMGDLYAAAELELEKFQKYGVGCLEVKSGYGLTLESELKILEVVEELKKTSPVWLVSTFMPAHATPPEFRGRTEEYVDEICRNWIPEVAAKKWATFFDVFVEEGYFSVPQARRLCETAKEHGMKIKLHCEQFKDLDSTALAVDLGATSCDHLDHISDANVEKLAESDTVAVLLPGASLFTGTPYPPARKLIDAGARVAISTDYNPGTCPSRNLPLMTTLACSQMKMTVPEALAAITYNAAAALGLENSLGSLEAGKPFRICQLNGASYEVLPYCFGELE